MPLRRKEWLLATAILAVLLFVGRKGGRIAVVGEDVKETDST